MALFECGICKFAKSFEMIAEFVGTKDAQEVIEFYFAWKNTTHYKIWKTK